MYSIVQKSSIARKATRLSLGTATGLLALAAAVGAAAQPAAGGAPAAAAAEESLSHGYFEQAPIYRPAGAPRQVALVISGAGGWLAPDAALAEALRRQGTLAAGVDLRRLVRAKRRDGAGCIELQGDLDNFSRFLQARYQLDGYRPPVLVGHGPVGAAMAYGSLATAAEHTFSGAISWGFQDGVIQLPARLCAGAAAFAQPQPGSGHGYRLRPSARLGGPWLVFPDPAGAATAATLVQAVPGATLLGPADPQAAGAQVATAVARLLPQQQVTAAPPPAVGDLPLVEAPASAGGEHDLLAIMLSGDGGWAGIDKDLASALNRAGIPVVGFDSLRYFWKARSPDSSALDLARVLRYYQSQPAWRRARVLLIGYSQGADVLPFIINRLPADLRAQLASAVLIGMGEKASFEFHVSNWIKSSGDGLPTLPEARRLPPGLALCAYGIEDKDAVCPRLEQPGSPVRILGLKGGHHFDGNYDRLAAVLLKAVAAPAGAADQNRSAR